MPNSGVFPVYDNVFKIGTKGRASASPGDLVDVYKRQVCTMEGYFTGWAPAVKTRREEDNAK